MVLGGLTALVGVSLVTAGPLFALWVGARFQTEVGLSMTTVGVTAGVLIVITFVLYKAFTRLSAAYDDAVRRTGPRGQLPWLAPVGVERRAIAAGQPRSATDWIAVAAAAAAVVAFVIWFFFLA
jgi:hypothetical protein